MSQTPPPRGTLLEWPLPTLFVHILEHGLSGSLVIESLQGDVDVVVFAEGAPTRVRTAELVAPLGEMLVRYGVLADVDLESALHRAGTAKARIGQQLVSEQVIDRRVLLQALREQVMVRLRRIATIADSATYEFHGNSDLLDDGSPTGATSCDPLAALLTLVRAWPGKEHIDRHLAGLGDRRVVMHRDAQPDRFELDVAEQLIVERMRTSSKLTYAPLLRSTLAPIETIRALVYTLSITHHLATDEVSLPLDVEPSADPLKALRDSSLNNGAFGERTNEVRREVAAAEDHREAEMLLRAGNLVEAESLARRAMEQDDAKPAYRALLGHILGTRDVRKNGKQALALLDAAIADDPRADRSLVLRATLHERAGRSADARKDYAAALALNPSNAEAARALRGGVRDAQRPSAWRKDLPSTPLPSAVPPEVAALAAPNHDGSRDSPAASRWIAHLTAALVVATLVLLVFYFASGH